jgi:hypothetical protein
MKASLSLRVVGFLVFDKTPVEGGDDEKTRAHQPGFHSNYS